MLIIIGQPENIGLSRSVAAYRLRMTTATGEAFGGRPARTSLSMPEQEFLDGKTFGISITAPNGVVTTVHFTAKIQPTGEADIPVFDPSNGLPGYGNTSSYLLGAVVPKLNAHHRLSPFATFSSSLNINSAPTLTAVLHADLVGYSATWINGNLENPYPMSSPAEADQRPVNARVDYTVYFENHYNSGAFTNIFDGVLYPDTEGGVLLADLSNLLDTHCVTSACGASLTAMASPNSAVNGNNLRRYYVIFTEGYGSPIVAHESRISEVKTILMGGVSHSARSPLAESIGNLSFAPNRLTVSESAPLFFNFINARATSLSSLGLRLQGYDVTGFQIVSVVFPQVAVGPFETLSIPVSPQTFGIPPTVMAYTVELVDSIDGAISYSSIRHYTIERMVSPDERILAWHNGFGGLETLRVDGIIQSGSTITRKEAILNNRQKVFNAEWKPTLTYRTSPLSAAQREWLTEIMVGGQLYEILNDGYVPLFVTSLSVADSAIDDNLTYLDIKAVPVQTDMPFSTDFIFTNADWVTYRGTDEVRRFMVNF